MLQIRLLGQFDVRYDGATIEIPTRPGQALLAYLALNPGVAHRRERLAGIFWPDSVEANARANLRAALWRLRKSFDSAGVARSPLQADDLSITFDDNGCWTDAYQLQSASTEASIEELIDRLAVYRGELLPGFYDEWVIPERERLQALYERGLARLVEMLLIAQRWDEALEFAERWISQGAGPEAAYRAAMQAHAGRKDRTGVTAAYRRCVEVLRRDFGVEPTVETKALYQRLVSDQATAPANRATANDPESKSQFTGTGRAELPPQATEPSLPRLPMQPTPFIGRVKELEEISSIAAKPDCRLLTLLGPGGVGKTRLALEAAGLYVGSEAYPDGVVFVPLAPLQSAAFLLSALAEALYLTLSGRQSIEDQIASYLSGKRMLLVLDNLEHLLDGAAMIGQLLSAAPGIKVLVTSRERLNLRAEWLFEIGGLDYPPVEEVERLGEYGAVRLFLETARRAEPRFEPTQADLQSIVQICHAVAGLPLAIELAAAWARHMPVAAIAGELGRGLGLLSASLRDAPARHQNIRAVFDHSWRLLTEEEQSAFRRLAVFRGGFDLAAGQAISGAPVTTLTALADKSLIRRVAAGRFELHELLRYYAAESLETAGETTAIQRRHLEWCLALAEAAEPFLRGHGQMEWVSRLEADHDNLRAALDWSAQAGEAEAGLRVAAALGPFWRLRGYIVEGTQQLDYALAAAPQAPALLRWRALLATSALMRERGEVERARALAYEALLVARQAQSPLGIAHAQSLIGEELSFSGDRAAAVEVLTESLAGFRRLDHKWGIASTLLFLADTRMRLGQIEFAAAQWQESLALFRELGDDWGLAYALGGSGEIAKYRGDLEGAKSILRESMQLSWRGGNRVDIAYKVEALAIIALIQNWPEQAARLWGAAEKLRETLNAPLPPNYRKDYEPHMEAARAALGEAGFQAEWDIGRALEGEKAIAAAMADKQ